MANMKRRFRWALALMPFAGFAGAQVVECTEEQRRGLVPSSKEVREHRDSPLPEVGYAYGTERSSWEFRLIVRVSAAGRVECYDEPPPSEFRDSLRGIEGPRRAVIEGLREWRYKPFLREGRPVPVVITETLREYEKPARRREIPEVPLDKVRISLERTSCFGTCPDYRVELFGDGRAIFTGNAFTSVRGSHRYSVPPSKVAALVERLRETDVWSSRPTYRAPVTDSSTNTLRIQLGKDVHEIEDYVGYWVGMPPAIDEFEDAVDEAAGSQGFVSLSMLALDALQREGFRFNSLEGAKLLARAVNDEDSDDTALARLVELGTPLVLPDGAEVIPMDGPLGPPLLKALEYRRGKAVEALLTRGALGSLRGPGQARIDAAFLAAIEGGDIKLVKRIWDIEGDTSRPSMTFEVEVGADEESKPKSRKNCDVITRIAPGHSPKPGDYREIAEFLVSHGSDLKARAAGGETLLHFASRAEDTGFIRFLLSKGLDPSAVDDDDVTPLGMTYSEEVSLMLLEAGSDVSKMGSENYSYRNFAQANGWYRVLAWLDAHGG
jgi:hypothetical protein